MDERHTDLIVDFLGDQFIVELKIWHDSEYNERGEKQLRIIWITTTRTKDICSVLTLTRIKKREFHKLNIGSVLKA